MVLSETDHCKRQPEFESYFINGRYIKSTLIAKALEDGYRGFNDAAQISVYSADDFSGRYTGGCQRTSKQDGTAFSNGEICISSWQRCCRHGCGRANSFRKLQFMKKRNRKSAHRSNSRKHRSHLNKSVSNAAGSRGKG